MAVNNQIVFVKEKRIANAAFIKSVVDKKVILVFLRVLVFSALFSAAVLFISPIVSIDLSLFGIILRFLVFLGLLALPIFIFIKSYFREIEEKINLDPSLEAINVYQVADLELVNILGKIENSQNNLDKFLLLVASSKRARFVLSEINAGTDQLQKVFGSLRKAEATKTSEEIFRAAIENALIEEEGKITCADVLLGLVMVSQAKDTFLRELEISENDLRNVIAWSNLLLDKFDYPKRLKDKLLASGAGIAQNWASGYTVNLNQFGSDLSSARSFENISVYGREDYLTQIESALTNDQKDNCILVGESGVGKNSLVFGLAERIYWGKTLPELRFKRVVYLDLSALLSGVSNGGQVSFRMMSVLKEAVMAGNIILLIDGIEKLFIGNSEKVGTVDVEEIILPFLQNSKIKIVGITTKEGYQTYIAPKAQVSANFEKIEVPPMDESQTIRVLEDLSLYYTGKYNLKITYNALKEVYSLADKFISNKEFPGKAVDMLNSICSAAKNSGQKILDKNAIDLIESKSLHVPIASAGTQEKKTLLNLESKLHQRVIGQEEAVQAVSDSLRRARTKIDNNKRPIGTFLFLGPTGVGKTELSKALAWSYFGDENTLVRMDMNEYQSISSIDRFIGKKVLQSDQLEGGEFVKKVREKPFSVVLLDELEKAHPDILNLFLQMLDEGYIIDGMGQRVNLTNSIIIATSNAGANLIREGVSQNVDLNSLKDELLDYLQKENIYRPEFLNRFDGVIIFKPLTKEELLQITKLMFANLISNLKVQGYLIEIDDETTRYLIDLGYKPESGAREIRRVLQDRVENRLAKMILENKISKGEVYKITVNDLKNS